MNWRIHDSCSFVIRLKALGIPVNPIDSCQCSTPQLRAQLDLTNDHKKKKITTPANMSWNLTWSCVWNAKLSSLSSSIGKGGCCRSFRLPSLEVQAQRWFPGTAGSSSTHDSTGWKLKQGQQFTLLRRITRLKTVNSDVVLLSTVSLERLSPRGSYHLDGTGMSDTLNQKHLTELLVWSASFVHKQFSKSARKIIYEIRREKPERGTLTAKFWCSSNFRLRKPCKTGKQFGWKRLGGSWVSHIPYRKIEIEAGTSMSVLTDITGNWWVSLLVPVSSVPPAPPALKGRT